MQIREILTHPAISIAPEESVAVAARTLAHYNIGSLPVCGADGRLCGLVTDRDLVTRCLASGRAPENTRVKDVMTAGMTVATPDMTAADAAQIMGAKQIRRLPVVDREKVVGMVSLGDMAKCTENGADAAAALTKISSNPAVFDA